MRAILSFFLLSSALVPGLAVADTALLIGNSRYEHAAAIRAADDLLDARRNLTTAGFTVVDAEDRTSADMRAMLSDLLPVDPEARLIVALSGHFVTSAGGQTWFLGRDADTPNLATVAASGVTLATVFEIASDAAGQVVVLLGAEDRDIPLGPGLRPGIGPVAAPQGVTVITGEARHLARFLRSDLLEPGQAVATQLEDWDLLTGFGYLPRGLPFLPYPAAEGAAQPGPVAPSPDEQALWAAAIELDSEGAYAAYLQEYPGGAYATEAAARLDAIRDDPVAQARRAEEALQLTRGQRQEIQRDLTLLEHNPRGIDGIFGPGSRGAIASWQTASGYAATGYLDQPQIATLSTQADERAAALEEEARIRAEDQARADRAYWQATGQGSDEAGLRAYLDRYPDGAFAALARTRLADIEAAAQQDAAAEDRAAWEEARARDRIPAYTAYLQRFPNGAFANAAAARIEELRGEDQQAERRAQLEAREAALNLSPVTRQLVEQRLAVQGLNPGRVDGTFDRDTRRALRRYQQARNLSVTGYLDQATVVRLMADAVGGILQ